MIRKYARYFLDRGDTGRIFSSTSTLGSWSAAVAIVLAILVVTAQPGAAATNGITHHDNATELGNGTLTNSEVERSGDPAVVGHDLARAQAVGRWDMDVGSGSTAYDHVASNDLSFGGDPQWTTGYRGQAIDLDGTGDYLSEGDSTILSSDNNWTISAWINPDSFAGQNPIFVEENVGSGDTRNYVFLDGSGHLTVDQFTPGGGAVASSQSIPTDAWTHVTVVETDGKWFLYINGSLDTVNASEDYTGAAPDDWKIGGRESSNHYSDIQIDGVRIYSEPMSPAQVERLHEAPQAKFSSEALERWAFENGTGTTAYADEGADGTITNATWIAGDVSDQALDLDGTTDYVQGSAPVLSGDNNLTITGWINHTENSDGTIFVEEDTDSGHTRNLVSLTGQNTLQFDQFTPSGGAVRSNTTIPQNTWTHFAIVEKAGRVFFYINGSLSNTNVSEDYTGSAPEYWIIGNRLQTNGWDIDARFDDMRVYDRALDNSSIQHLHEHPTWQLNETSRYNNTHSATYTVEGFTDLTLRNATATVEWNTAGGTTLSTATYTTSGNKTQSWAQSDADTVTVNVTFESTDQDHVARLDDDGVNADTKDPIPDNSSMMPEGSTTSTNGTLSIDISDPDFPTVQGDQVTATFYVNGSVEGTDTLASNGTASITSSPLAGQSTWWVELEDSYGNTARSANSTIAVPSTLSIYNETAVYLNDSMSSAELVDNVTVELRFFYNESNPTITLANTSDGTINMTGLPADVPIVVVANGGDYVSRRIYVSSLFETQSVFLLPENRTHVEQELVLRDYTGEYPKEDSVLYIQRGLNGTWRTVEGDIFGATGSFNAQLRYNARHRLVVENTVTGSSRVLGPHIPTSNNDHLVKITAEGGVEVESLQPILSYAPSVARITSTTQSVEVTIRNGSTPLQDYDVTFIVRDGASNTTLATVTGSNSSGETFSQSLKLSGEAGNNLTVKVNYTLTDGTTGSDVEVYAIAKHYINDYSLINVAGGVGALLPSSGFSQFSSVFGLLIAVVIAGAIASSYPASSEEVGVTVILIVAAFASLGWVGWDYVFALVVAFGSFAALRRGL